MTTNADKIERFSAIARAYARAMRDISADLRNLKALRIAQEFITDHTGEPNQDINDALQSLESAIAATICYLECTDRRREREA